MKTPAQAPDADPTEVTLTHILIALALGLAIGTATTATLAYLLTH